MIVAIHINYYNWKVEGDSFVFNIEFIHHSWMIAHKDLGCGDLSK